MRRIVLVFTLLAAAGCSTTPSNPSGPSFANDVRFLRHHTRVVLLKDADSRAMVAVTPEYQGRVMTSTAQGGDGRGYGWINRALIASGQLPPHIVPYGGEDRFWLGPEGGQFAIFFAPDVPFDLEHWQTPAVIDTEPFNLITATGMRAVMQKEAQIRNRAGFTFNARIDRTVRLLHRPLIAQMLGVPLPDRVDAVAYESVNRLTNTSSMPWKPETGLLSIWILGMFQPGPATTVVIPIVPGSPDTLGPRVNDAYFGKVPANRLVEREHVLFFRGDGGYRSKIGVSPARAKTVIGSYDADAGQLTLVQYTLPANATQYVNSMWELQKNPYGGDVVNAYNDGPPAPGAQPLGPFYELETSSPAAALGPNETLTHTHRTYHFAGPEAALDAIAQAALGVGLAEIKAAFPATP